MVERQPAVRELDADVLEAVLARAQRADQIVAVDDVQGRRPRLLVAMMVQELGLS